MTAPAYGGCAGAAFQPNGNGGLPTASASYSGWLDISRTSPEYLSLLAAFFRFLARGPLSISKVLNAVADWFEERTR